MAVRANALTEPGLSPAALADALRGLGGDADQPPSDLSPQAVGAYAIRALASIRRPSPSLRALPTALARTVGDTVGAGHVSFTTSGTQSILLGLMAARSQSASRRVICAATAHPAVRRAAQILRLELVTTPTDAAGRADVGAMVQACAAGAAAVVVSTPVWAWGVSDPVAEIAAAARDHGVACHVDACIGGFLHPFQAPEDGVVAPSLALPGVTSASIDLHKFGYAPAPLSAACIFDLEFAGELAFRDPDWDGFPYGTDALGGDPPFLAVGAAWAVMRALGEAGYRGLAEALRVRRDLAAHVLASFGEVMAPAHSPVVTVRPPNANLARLTDRLLAAGAAAIACPRPGFVRVRIDATAPEGAIAAWADA